MLGKFLSSVATYAMLKEITHLTSYNQIKCLISAQCNYDIDTTLEQIIILL